ncbi:MAG: precorrin-8X methylmutase [Acidimicrobiales bacterium]
MSITSHPSHTIHPIEEESFRIMESRVDLSSWPAEARQVVARVVHATADLDFASTIVVSDGAAEAGIGAIAAGAPVICDVEMVRAGLSIPRTPADRAQPVLCYLSEVEAEPTGYPTRSAKAMRLAAERHPQGAVVVVGCAPSALDEVMTLAANGMFRPSLVIALPVGFVGSREAKERAVALGAELGIPVIANRSERGGSAAAAAAFNALARAARRTVSHAATHEPPALLLIGHGSRSAAGVAELRAFVDAVGKARPDVLVGHGIIEHADPDLATGIDALVSAGATEIIAVPLVLLGAGHMKDDGPVALHLARERHPGLRARYSGALGVHPQVLSVIQERAVRAGGGQADAVVIVGRGSTDPDANSDLAKAARLLADNRHIGTGGDATASLGTVEAAFVSLAHPDVKSALDRCRQLGAERICVVPYFLFTGILPERISHDVDQWSQSNPGIEVTLADEIGVDPRVVELVWQRYDQARAGTTEVNCDCCAYRAPMPGYEHKARSPLPLAGH